MEAHMKDKWKYTRITLSRILQNNQLPIIYTYISYGEFIKQNQLPEPTFKNVFQLQMC